eukprot:TRINITY_DN7580_c0_g2_i2.p1 TRINITY_DN7580_c0_g2~~TRINITY_DN7580_c0_g2_i2.p1  ORF type:complete len:2095 (-),score=426.44 TRINITY_DN7580_c0_g2_i2:1764-8048(-)
MFCTQVGFQVALAFSESLQENYDSQTDTYRSFGLYYARESTDVFEQIVPDALILLLGSLLLRFIDWKSEIGSAGMFTQSLWIKASFFLCVAASCYCAVSYPSIMSTPFMGLYVLFLYYVYTNETLRPRVENIFHFRILAGYIFAFLLVIQIYDLPVVDDFLPSYVGFQKTSDLSSGYRNQIAGLVLLSHGLFFLIRSLKSAEHKMKEKESKTPQHSLPPSEDGQESLDLAQGTLTNIHLIGKQVEGHFISRAAQLKSVLHTYFRLYGWTISAAFLLLLSLSNVSVFGSIYMTWFLLGLIFPHRLYAHWCHVITCYTGSVFLMQYFFNLTGAFSETQDLNDIGFRLHKDPIYDLSLYLLNLLFLCINKRLTRTVYRQSQDLSSKDSKMRTYLRKYVWKPLTQHAYKISLVLLFILASAEINLFHVGYLVFFVAYLIFVDLARRFWIVLVVYCEAVITVLYMWQIKFIQTDSDAAEVAGLQIFTSPTEGLLFYITIHCVVAAQYHVFESSLDLGFKATAAPEHLQPLIQNAASGQVTQAEKESTQETSASATIDYVIDFLRHFFNSFGLAICYFIYLVNGVGSEACVINLIYVLVGLFGTYLFIITPNHRMYASKLWVGVTVYAGFVLCTRYAYQFEAVHDGIEELWPADTKFDIRQLGYEVYNDDSVFGHLVGNAVVLVVSVFQYRVFAKEKAMDPSIKTRVKMPSKLEALTRFFKRALIINEGLVMRTSLFTAAIRSISIMGGIYLLLFVILITFLKQGARLHYIASLYGIIFAVAVYIFQMEYFESYWTDDYEWVGLKKYQDVFDGLQPHLVMIILTTLQTASASWAEELSEEERLESGETKCTLFIVGERPRPRAGYLAAFVWMGKVFVNEFSMFKELLIIVSLLSAFTKLSVFGVVHFFSVPFYMLAPLSLSKKANPYILFYHALALALQYFVILGPPPSQDKENYWNSLDQDWQQWLGLDVDEKLELYADFFVFFFTVLHARFTKEEKSTPDSPDGHGPAGYHRKRWSTLTTISYIFHRYSYRAVLYAVFALGTVTYDIPSLGFIMSSLYLLCHQDSLQPTFLGRWKGLILYSYTVLTMKLLFQIPSLPDSDSDDSLQHYLGVKKLKKLEGLNDYGMLTDVLTFLIVCGEYKLMSSERYNEVIRYVQSKLDKRLNRVDEAFDRIQGVLRRIAEDQAQKRAARKARLEKYREKMVTASETASEVVTVIDPETEEELGKSAAQITTSGEMMEESPDDNDASANLDWQSYFDDQQRQSTSTQNVIQDASEEITVDATTDIRSPLHQSLWERVKKTIYTHIRNKATSHYLNLLEIDDSKATDSENEIIASKEIGDYLLKYIRYNTHNIAFMALFLTSIVYADLVSIVYTLFLFPFLRLEYPQPRKTSWVIIIIFTEVVLIVKYIFQFSVFCYCYDGRITYSLQNECETDRCLEDKDVLEDDDAFGIPTLIGIKKFDGEPYFASAILDVLILLTVLSHISNLEMMGAFQLHEKIWSKMQGRNIRNMMSDMPGSSSSIEPSSTPVMKKELGVFQKWKKLLLNYWSKVTAMEDRPGKDLYFSMFSIEILGFFYVALMYPYIISNNTIDISESIEKNSIPGQYVFLLIFLFSWIVVDRIVYLYRSLRMKLAIQFFTVFLVHYLCFYAVPDIAGNPFSKNPALVVVYLIKSLYFFVSALQIYHGYPPYTGGQFLMSRYSKIWSLIFTVYRAIPFVFELRTLLDWICIDTSLTLNEFFKLEDIYGNLYLRKCDLIQKEKDALPPGTKQPSSEKFFTGVVMFVLLALLVWFPLIVITASQVELGTNLVSYASISIGIPGYLPFFTGSIDKVSIRVPTESQYDEYSKYYDSLESNELEQAEILTFSNSSQGIWQPSPASRNQLVQSLNGSEPIRLAVFLFLYRQETPQGEYSVFSNVIDLGSERYLLAEAIAGNSSLIIDIPNAIPRVIDLPSEDKPRNAEPGAELTVRLQIVEDLESGNDYWFAGQYEDPVWPGTSITILSMSEPLKEAISALITSAGITGLYFGVVLTVGKFLRISVTNLQQRIMFDDLPNVARLQLLCNDIFNARAERDLRMEHEFYLRLIDIYRSPETLIVVTKPKHD